MTHTISQIVPYSGSTGTPDSSESWTVQNASSNSQSANEMMNWNSLPTSGASAPFECQHLEPTPLVCSRQHLERAPLYGPVLSHPSLMPAQQVSPPHFHSAP